MGIVDILHKLSQSPDSNLCDKAKTALQQYLAWWEHPGHLRASHILVKGSTGTSLIWFLLFAQVTLDCRELFYKSSLVGLDLKFILRTFFWGSNFLRGLLCFVLFLSELPGLFIRTINYFPLDLQFFAYAAATLWVRMDMCLHTQMCVCVCVCGWRSGWMNMCVWGIPQSFLFLFCVKISFLQIFQGLSIACCIKKKLLNYIQFEWNVILKTKQLLSVP